MDTVTEMLNTTKCSQENCREISTNLTLLQDKVDSWPSAGTESLCQCTDQIAGLETLLYEVYIYLHIIYISSTYLLTKVTGSLCPAEQCRDTAQQLELTQRRVESVQEKLTFTINNIIDNISLFFLKVTIINQTKCSAAECEQMSGQLASVVSIADSLVTEQDNLAANIQDVQLSSCSKSEYAKNRKY